LILVCHLDESYKLPEMEPISNSMGLFLQKTNIIRDYLEDISEQPPRIFWPREIWSKYANIYMVFFVIRFMPDIYPRKAMPLRLRTSRSGRTERMPFSA
jgi:hypothetical protein